MLQETQPNSLLERVSQPYASQGQWTVDSSQKSANTSSLHNPAYDLSSEPRQRSQQATVGPLALLVLAVCNCFHSEQACLYQVQMPAWLSTAI